MPPRSHSRALQSIALVLATGLALPAGASEPEPAQPEATQPEPAQPEATQPEPAQPSSEPPVTSTTAPSDSWDDEPSPAAPVPIYVVPAPTGAPDPALVERNRKLSEKMQYGERRLIAGRIAAGIGLTFVAVGGVMFAVASLDGPLEADRTNALWAGGGVLMGLGVVGVAAGIGLWVRGSRIVKQANRGELSFRVRPTAYGFRF